MEKEKIISEIRKQEKAAVNEVFEHIIIAVLSMTLLFVVQKFFLGGRFLGNIIIETPKIYCGLIWLVFATLSGCFEAFYYTHELHSDYQDNFNEHPMLNVMRSCLLIPLWILTDWQAAICYWLMFYFLHDGNYYRWRDRLKPGTYPKGWNDWSKTSTALQTKYTPSPVRVTLFIISLTWLTIQVW